MQFNNGKVDGWLKEGSDTDEFALGYYEKGDLGFIQDATAGATTFDRFFCSILASTFPNREYMWAAQSYGRKDNSLPATAGRVPVRDDAVRRGRARGRDGRLLLQRPARCRALGARRASQRASRVEDYYAACAERHAAERRRSSTRRSRTAAVATACRPTSTRTATCASARRTCRTSSTPSWSRRSGSAARSSSSTTSGAASSTTCGPPRVPDIRNSRNLDEDFGQMGFRIPALVLSPYARRGHVDHGTYGFESIIKLIRYRFGAKAADAARRVRAQHRPRVRLARQAAARAARASRPGQRGDGHLHRARARLPAARAAPQPAAAAAALPQLPRSGRSRTTSRCSSRPATWTAWASPTTRRTRRRCSASRRRCWAPTGAPCEADRRGCGRAGLVVAGAAWAATCAAPPERPLRGHPEGRPDGRHRGKDRLRAWRRRHDPRRPRPGQADRQARPRPPAGRPRSDRLNGGPGDDDLIGGDRRRPLPRRPRARRRRRRPRRRHRPVPQRERGPDRLRRRGRHRRPRRDRGRRVRLRGAAASAGAGTRSRRPRGRTCSGPAPTGRPGRGSPPTPAA